MVTSTWLPLTMVIVRSSISTLLALLPSHQPGFLPAHTWCALAKLVLSDVSHKTQGSRVAYPERIILGTYLCKNEKWI